MHVDGSDSGSRINDQGSRRQVHPRSLCTTEQQSDSSDGRFDPYSIDGVFTFARLLQHGKTWFKSSAPYRVDLKPNQLDAVAGEILCIRSDRVVFATNWPHTHFEGLDIKPFEQRCLEWAEEAGSVQRVFSTNAKELWGI